MPLPADKPAYTVSEVAALTGFCAKTVRRMFEREAGVIKLARPASLHKRRYVSLRIPSAVYRRVIERLK
jgi:hypothetical protein